MSLATVKPPKATPIGPSALPTVPSVRANAPPSASDGMKRERVLQFFGLSASPNSASRPVLHAFLRLANRPVARSQLPRLERKFLIFMPVPSRPTAVPRPLIGVHSDLSRS